MAITDLTGTKWVFSTGISSISPNKPYAFSLSFASHDLNFTSLTIPRSGADNPMQYDSTEVYDTAHEVWNSVYWRIIEITGGIDATNPDLITWLETNATQVQVDDLTDTKWVLNKMQYPLSASMGFNISFISNTWTFRGIFIGDNSHQGVSTINYYADNDVDAYSFASNSWVDEAYRIIEITGGDDVSNPDLLAWLNNNATQVPVVDLSNTKWVLNRDLGDTTPSGTLYAYGIMHSFRERHYITFSSNDSTFISIDFHGTGEGGGTELIYGTGISDVYARELTSMAWDNQAYRNISIADGTDAINPDLIVWLTDNATLQEEPTPITTNTYQISRTLTNMTKGNTAFTIMPSEGYSLPESINDITITNGTIISYNNQTGVLVIDGSDVTEIRCECIPTATEVR